MDGFYMYILVVFKILIFNLMTSFTGLTDNVYRRVGFKILQQKVNIVFDKVGWYVYNMFVKF
jgi:hypothetical protein